MLQQISLRAVEPLRVFPFLVMSSRLCLAFSVADVDLGPKSGRRTQARIFASQARPGQAKPRLRLSEIAFSYQWSSSILTDGEMPGPMPGPLAWHCSPTCNKLSIRVGRQLDIGSGAVHRPELITNQIT